MKIKKIIEISKKPELYTKGTAVMWTDEHISKQLLEVHLNTELDLASRKKETIKNTVGWILKQTNENRLNILDLGCGPGLYTEMYAKKGHTVTGVDFSANSIQYAQKSAKEQNLNIRYLNQNYLELKMEKEQFDLVTLIYTDFGVLHPEDRKKLLSFIKKVLKPEGVLIFDVLNDKNIELKLATKSWEATQKGHWRNSPYLALSESFLYKKEKVILYQHTVIEESGKTDVYRFWTHFFSDSDLKSELKICGFNKFAFHTNVLPKTDIWNGENVTFCVAN